MPILPIYTYSQPVLRKKAKPVRQLDDEFIKFVEDMFETMYNANGLGLAANQVGSLQRVLVLDVSDMEETKDFKPMVLINPEVVSEQGKWSMEEGCLSIPDIRYEVERPHQITVRYRDLEFNDCQIDVQGLLARVILHEVDHLNGVLFIDRIETEQQKLLRGRLNKIRRGEFEVEYPTLSEETPAQPQNAIAK